MIVQPLTFRQVTSQDRQSLASLVHFEKYIHRHLDWKSPLEWIGSVPYLVAERNHKIVAALACPIEPPGVAWIRLLAVAGYLNRQKTWRKLWKLALNELRKLNPSLDIVAIPMDNWFIELLEENNFNPIDKVVILVWSYNVKPAIKVDNSLRIREMSEGNLQEVTEVDNSSFAKIWQNSLNGVTTGFKQSTIATIACIAKKIVGYQISTLTSGGGHLARLAVLPDFQGHGIGTGLVNDLLVRFYRRGISNVTVNTQISNRSSLAIYQKTGFTRTAEEFPVYKYID